MRKREYQQLHARILALLKEYPDTRNSDIYLTLKFWLKHFSHKLDLTDPKNPTVSFQAIRDVLPREEHIRRIRAHIQNIEKKYPPTSWEVAKQRRWNQETWKGLVTEQRMIDEYDPLKGKNL